MHPPTPEILAEYRKLLFGRYQSLTSQRRLEAIYNEIEKRGEMELLNQIVEEFTKQDIERMARIAKYSNDGNDYL